MFDNESTQKTSENRFSIEETAESGFGMIATTCWRNYCQRETSL